MNKILYGKITVDTDLWKLFQALIDKQAEIIDQLNELRGLSIEVREKGEN